jgi:hypothetical protein
MSTLVRDVRVPGPGEVEITSPLGIMVEGRLVTFPTAQPSALRTALASRSGTLLSTTTRHRGEADGVTALTVRVAVALLLAGLGSAILDVTVPVLENAPGPGANTTTPAGVLEPGARAPVEQVTCCPRTAQVPSDKCSEDGQPGRH